MRISSKCSALLIAGVAFFGTAQLAAAATPGDGDDSARATDGFTTQVAQSTGVLLRVPLNANGDEDTSAAEVRLYNNGQQVSGAQLTQAWQQATPVDPSTATVDKDTNVDSSTCGWNRWGYSGWAQPYYYQSYYPTYYYSGNYYRYSYNNSYSMYGNNGYGYGYRYYYYNRSSYYNYGSPYSYGWYY